MVAHTAIIISYKRTCTLAERNGSSAALRRMMILPHSILRWDIECPFIVLCHNAKPQLVQLCHSCEVPSMCDNVRMHATEHTPGCVWSPAPLKHAAANDNAMDTTYCTIARPVHGKHQVASLTAEISDDAITVQGPPGCRVCPAAVTAGACCHSVAYVDYDLTVDTYTLHAPFIHRCNREFGPR